MILNFRTDRFGQTVQTQVRLLLEEQSDQGLHCLLFHLLDFDKIPLGLAFLFEFKFSCVRKFRNLTVVCTVYLDLSVQNLREGTRWLSGRASDSGERGLGLETYLRRVVSLSKTLYSPKVLVILRKGWLHPDMTEKLLTWTTGT